MEEQLILEHEGRAALFEMGEAIPDASELPGVTIPDPPAPEPEAQGGIPGMEGPPAPGEQGDRPVVGPGGGRAGADGPGQGGWAGMGEAPGGGGATPPWQPPQ